MAVEKIVVNAYSAGDASFPDHEKAAQHAAALGLKVSHVH